MTTQALLDINGIAQLRAALTAANYTAAGIAARIGPAATEAARRNDLRGALKATEERDPLATLIRLFVCGQTEPGEAVAEALAPLPLASALAARLVVPDQPGGTGLRQGVDLEPYTDSWWIVADVAATSRPGRPLPGDHVLGVGGASETLAAATVRRPVATALDLGTGSGIQALHLSTHAGRVTATDLSPRALCFAATTAALNGLEWELLGGDLVEPVAGRRFDLVVSNPPFVAGPGTATHTYRDSGRPGDAVSAELCAAAPGLLAPGGTMQFLANWLHVKGQDWGDRVAGWVEGSGLDAWVIQREVADPLAYVQLWLADAAEATDPGRAAAWLEWFDAHGVEGIGFGLVNLRAGGHDDPVIRVEDLRQTVEPPLGDRVNEWYQRQDWLRAVSTEDILRHRYRAAKEITLRQDATLGPEGWDVQRQVLVQRHGLRWQDEIDPVALALVAGADGTVPLRDQLAVLAVAHEVPEEDLIEVAAPIVAHLVERGFLEPAPGRAPSAAPGQRTGR
jgi:methylase of polypeptide subunit release factors